MMKNKNIQPHINLPVPAVHQPPGSSGCSLAALKMIMNYWGDAVPYGELVTDLSEWVNEKERHLQGIGVYLAKRGYSVSLVHHDTNVIDKETENLTEEDKQKLVEAFASIPEGEQHTFQRKKLALDIAYIASGGKYKTTVPTLEFIDTNLESSNPVMTCVSLRVLTSSPTKINNHYVVVIGKEGDEYVVNDPNAERVSPYKVNKDKFLMAWYACGAYALAARLN